MDYELGWDGMQINIETIYFFTSVFFFTIVLRKTFYWIAVWQENKFDFKRVLNSITSKEKLKQIFFTRDALIKYFLFFLFFLSVFYFWITHFYMYIIALFYGYMIVQLISQAYHQEIVIPKITISSTAIFVGSVLLLIICYVVPLIDTFFWLIVLDTAVIFFVGVSVLLVSIPKDFYKDMRINKAIKSLGKNKRIQVIQVIGNEKDITADRLEQVLSHKYNVVVNESGSDTPFEVAEIILKKITDKTQILIIKTGLMDIDAFLHITLMVKPSIAIFTSMSELNISLSKNKKTDYERYREILEVIPHKCTVLVHEVFEERTALFKNVKRKKIQYQIAKRKQETDDEKIQGYSVKLGKQATKMRVKIKKRKLGELKIPLIGLSNIYSILAAFYVAKKIGMKSDEIKEAIQKLQPVKDYMGITHHKSGAVLLNNTGNDIGQLPDDLSLYLPLFKGKRIVVLPPVKGVSKEKRRKIIEERAAFSDHMILISNKLPKKIKEKLSFSSHTCLIQYMYPKNACHYLDTTLDKKDVVVFEGEGSKKILRSLLEEE